MAMITNKIYGKVEYHLRNRSRAGEEARKRLEQVKADCYSLSGVSYDATPVQGGEHSGLDGRVSRILEAEQAVIDADAWEGVAVRAYDIYPPDSPEGQVACLIYEEHHSQADVCTILSVDRQTVRRRKDAFVLAAALVAADRGLIRREVWQNG